MSFVARMQSGALYRRAGVFVPPLPFTGEGRGEGAAYWPSPQPLSHRWERGFNRSAACPGGNPVSYTHLDVYKRQRLAEAERKPVSYTDLDVYKRQTVVCAARMHRRGGCLLSPGCIPGRCTGVPASSFPLARLRERAGERGRRTGPLPNPSPTGGRGALIVVLPALEVIRAIATAGIRPACVRLRPGVCVPVAAPRLRRSRHAPACAGRRGRRPPRSSAP